jgi:hypothetical protein
VCPDRILYLRKGRDHSLSPRFSSRSTFLARGKLSIGLNDSRFGSR